MGFLTKRATFLRLKVNGPNPGPFGDEHLDRLREFEAGRQRIASADGVECGWTAGGHALDTGFEPAKNVVEDTLNFELRVDSDKLPADLLESYYAVEMKALAANNPSGFPSARQKREAKEFARERLEQEAKDGRFKKRKRVPILWDGATNEVLFGATAVTHLDRFASLFRQTFGLELECVPAGRRAGQLAELFGWPKGINDVGPSMFLPGVSGEGMAWIADDASGDFLGNEFLLWLWFTGDAELDAVKLSDGSEVVFMLARRLALECPRGQTGHETISSEGPARLPEARRAIQAGKLPRKVGLTLVRHDQQYEFVLHAESLGLGSVKFPASEEEAARARLDERVARLRHLLETLDLLYVAFLSVRLSAKWADTLGRMQRWLARGAERAAV